MVPSAGLYLCPTSSPQVPTPVRRLLIANRGEIALRIIKTCHLQSIETVSIYSSIDSNSPHVPASTSSINLGPISPILPDGTPGLNPYMNPDLLIKTALENKCDALHPGYGYLSENPDFADKVASTTLPWKKDGSKLRFLGPKGQVMREMGDKSSSKRLLKKEMGENAPLVPGYEGNSGEKDQEIENLVKEGVKVGFPIMIKASAGGGGRGMRIVWEEKNLKSELERARSESLRSFSSSVLLLERYIAGGKHIEVQIFGDNYGNVYSLGERECSVQRRHQKVIEESPSPSLSSETRKTLHESAVKIGKLLDYTGAATIEYIYDASKNEFFFLEINTRLQVEHPVTEMVFGIDLVGLQLYIGGGGNLNDLEILQNLEAKGHSIECRICSEEPGSDFSPKTGLVRLLEFGMRGQEGCRLDSGIETSSNVSIHFDAMLAKLIIHSQDRESCIEKTLSALRTTPILGVVTNTSFLASCLDHQEFRKGTYSTSLIPENLEKLLNRTRQIVKDGLVSSPAGELDVSKSDLNSLIPLQLVIPAFLFFYQLREILRPKRIGLFSTLRLHSSDSAQVSTEIYTIQLPDDLGFWEVVLEYKKIDKLGDDQTISASGNEEQSGEAFEVKIWLNKGDEEEQKSITQSIEKAKKKAEKSGKTIDEKKLKNDLIVRRSGHTARYYASRSSRDALEGRDENEWKLGMQDSDILKTKVILNSSAQNFQFHSNQVPSIDSSSPDLNQERWVTSFIQSNVDGKTSNAFIASDEKFDRHEREAQEAWVWIPSLSGQIKVVRKGLRVWAGRLEERAGGGGSDDLTYTTPMPCKILQLLSKDGSTVKQGDGILVMESMKTEVTVRAKTDGTLKMSVKEGETLGEGATLCVVDPE